MFLLVTPEEITTTTILGGSVDYDKYSFCIDQVQRVTIERRLGTLLYDKVVELVKSGEINDVGNEVYLELYTDYIKPILKYESCAQYLEISPYMVTNGGLFRHSPENAETVDKEEAMMLGQKYSALAQTFLIRLDKFLCKNTIKEYKVCQDQVSASKVQVTGGLWFGKRGSTKKWYEQDLDNEV